MSDARKVLFLDVDGVLNRHRPVGDDGRLIWENWVHPELMARLNRIIDATGAVVVMSSTWRIGKRLADLRGGLGGVGFSGRLIGATPTGRCSWHEGMPCSAGHRGAEIAHWLSEHQGRVGNFVILDDESDMGRLREHLVQVDWQSGLSDGDVERAIARLNG
jgi:hypothetical protein